jgi:predicted short-subunit dehydrogenase-like oxidoreductase (DUF2520 family)
MKNQKPVRLLIGSGRLHKHLAHYFSLLNLPFLTWDRHQSSNQLPDLLSQADQVWLLISDSQIEEFAKENLAHYSGTIIHCSGAMNIAGMVDVHPLMTFATELYSLKQYESITFVSAHPGAKSLLLDLPNAVLNIPAEKKALYHALCVSSGNFTTLLWQEAGRGFAELGLPPEAWHPYLKQITHNLIESFESALTGPIARQDLVTMQKNIQSLEGSRLQKIYRSFAQSFLPKQGGAL